MNHQKSVSMNFNTMAWEIEIPGLAVIYEVHIKKINTRYVLAIFALL